MNKQRSKATRLMAASLTTLLGTGVAYADIVDVPGLTDPQRSAAIAVQDIFDTLDGRLGEGDELSDAELRLYSESRIFVHTANEILANGQPTSFSLQLDAEGLGFGLQWLAHEEVNTQSKLSNEVIGAQIANIAARLESLRSGVRGISVAGFQPGQSGPQTLHAANVRPVTGGSAGAASDDGLLGSPLGFFVNAGSAWGSRDPSDREDAFDFDGQGLTAGADYRISPQWIAGLALGYSDITADFDSALSVVEGEVALTGYTFTFYSSLYLQDFFLDATLGYGQADVETVRRISYPSNNPLVPGANEIALGDTQSDQLSLTLNGGYSWSFDATTLTLNGDLVWRDVTIDGYRESNAGPLNLEVRDQELASLTLGLGMQLSHAISLEQGVLIPQAGFLWLTEFEDDPNQTFARFRDDTTNSFFAVTSDAPDSEYGLANLDLSFVAPRGIQVYLSYQTPFALEKITAHSISGGVRWEF